jgi:hypothetical protein
MHRPWTLLLALVAAPAMFAISAAAAAESDPFERYLGKWLRVDHEADDAARYAAIDRATESMSIVFRSFARAVMRQRMQPVDEYVVEHDGEVGWIRSNIGEAYPLDGKPNGGAEADSVVSRIEGGLIRQSWRHGDASHGETFWHLDESGERLVITEQVNDSHFAAPIEFSTTYRRAAR